MNISMITDDMNRVNQDDNEENGAISVPIEEMFSHLFFIFFIFFMHIFFFYFPSLLPSLLILAGKFVFLSYLLINGNSWADAFISDAVTS